MKLSSLYYDNRLQVRQRAHFFELYWLQAKVGPHSR